MTPSSPRQRRRSGDGRRGSVDSLSLFVAFAALGIVTSGIVFGGVTGLGIPPQNQTGAADQSGDAADGPASKPPTATPDAEPSDVDGERTADDAPSAESLSDGPDSDGDGLSDESEREYYGTDPETADTDGDGYEDGDEVRCTDALTDADPLHQDVYLEVDSVKGEQLQEASVTRLRTVFADAPIDNPDGESGIDLHVHRSDGALPENGSVNSHRRGGDHNDLLDYRKRYYDGRNGGFYVLVSSDAAYRGDDYYVGAGRSGVVVMESLNSDEATASLLLHELGHAFGFDHSQDGVDEENYTVEEYPSVMSYNGLYEVMDYSDGSGEVGRDEWSFVEEKRYKPPFSCERDDS